ncbi:hypothetical protein [Dactylosporangium sp. NPDC051484]|uniref:hypothetical protein n=1 Tax=Dactylosporangium sp. NPDC051484 TaxID=3154942 RepID=UPI00344F1593
MADQHKIEINKAGVLDVGARLRDDADRDITPRSDRIKQLLMWHAVFGERSGSPVVQGAVNQYYGQMNTAIDFLDALIYNCDVLAQATRDIVAAYQHADTLSATDANTILLGASTKISDTAAQVEATRRTADAQDHLANMAALEDLHEMKRGAV